MSDLFTQIGNNNTQRVDKRKVSSESLLKVTLGAIATIIVALLASPWLPQIWDKLKSFLN